MTVDQLERRSRSAHPTARWRPTGNRVAVREILPGSCENCSWCHRRMVFDPSTWGTLVQCQIGTVGAPRIEYYHLDCYALLGEPYGPARELPTLRLVRNPAVGARHGD